jgi:hypothetical protein
MDSSQLTMIRNARALYSSFLSNTIRSSQGCNAFPITVLPPNSALMNSIGARYTTIDEYEIIDAASQCPAVGSNLGAPFTPDEIASLKLWLDAADMIGTADDTIITSWSDKSSAANNATVPVGVGASGPKYVSSDLNGLPGLAFNYDATSRILNAGNILNSDDFSIFVVGRYVSAAGLGSHYMVSSWKKEFPSQVAIGENSLVILPGMDDDAFISANRLSVPYSYSAGIPKLFEIVSRSNEMGTTLTAGITGSVQTITNSIQNTTSDIGRGFTIGGTLEAVNGILYKANVRINEIIVCGDDLSTDIRQKVEGYLSHKWGLTLPADHPWAESAP